MKNLIYLSTVLDQFNDPNYPSIAEAVMDKFHIDDNIKLIEPARMNWNRTDWLKAWDENLPHLSALIAWPRENFTIGMGMQKEISDCQDAGIPVWIVTNSLEFYSCFEIELLNVGSMRYFAVVMLRKAGK